MKNTMKKAGRPFKEIHYPSVNYHYVLYDLIDKNSKKLVRAIGSTESQAKAAVKFTKIKIKPTKVKDLTDKMGHHGAHKLLKKFGENWVCKEGNVFFESMK